MQIVGFCRRKPPPDHAPPPSPSSSWVSSPCPPLSNGTGPMCFCALVRPNRSLPLLLRSVALPAPSRSNLDRPDWIQRPQTADTPSGARFAKEPLADFIMEPTILYAFRFPRLLFWKAYFSFNRFKIKFHLITVLPLPLIAHNLFVLTPN